MRRSPDQDNKNKCVVSDASPNAPSLETKYRKIGDKKVMAIEFGDELVQINNVLSQKKLRICQFDSINHVSDRIRLSGLNFFHPRYGTR